MQANFISKCTHVALQHRHYNNQKSLDSLHIDEQKLTHTPNSSHDLYHTYDVRKHNDDDDTCDTCDISKKKRWKCLYCNITFPGCECDRKAHVDACQM